VESQERSIEPELVVRAQSGAEAKEVSGALAENSRKRAPYNGTDRIGPHQRGDRRYRQLAEQRRVDDEKVKVTKRGDCVNNRLFDIFHILNN